MKVNIEINDTLLQKIDEEAKNQKRTRVKQVEFMLESVLNQSLKKVS